jgi:hypothetical protein
VDAPKYFPNGAYGLPLFGKNQPFKTRGYPVTPALFLLLYGWMLCFPFIERPLPSMFGLVTVAPRLLFYKTGCWELQAA